MSDEFGWRGSHQEGIEWLTYTTTDLLTAADPLIALHDAVAAASPRPVLLIAGGAMWTDRGADGAHPARRPCHPHLDEAPGPARARRGAAGVVVSAITRPLLSPIC